MTIRVPSPEKIERYPWGAITFILFCVCTALVFALINRPKCDSADWKKAYYEEREKNDKLTTALIVQKYAIEEVKAKKDTVKNQDHENIN